MQSIYISISVSGLHDFPDCMLVSAKLSHATETCCVLHSSTHCNPNIIASSSTV